MANLDLLEKSIPVAPIKIAALKGCEELGKTVNDYLVQFRKELMEHRTNGIAWSGYAEESFLIDCDCPRFGTGEAKGVINESIRGIGIQKWKQGIGYSAVLCFLLILTAVYGTYRYEQAQLLRYEYVLTGAGIFALLLLMKQFMGFMNKEDMILDGLLDYMENTLPARKPVPDEQALKEQTREELIDKVTEGIRQTAASETKFSHMLTPEEEHIMREVIREYLI